MEEQLQILEEKVINMLKTCYDPEIPANIYDLGLIYGVDLPDLQHVIVTMTLTSPQCPVAESLPIDIKSKVSTIAGVENVDINVVWDPPWDPSKMSEVAKLQLNMF